MTNLLVEFNYMKKIKIYTLSDKRPDFIPIQYKTVVDHIQDDFEYIVLNNAVDSIERSNEIENICSTLDIKSIKVSLDDEYKFMNGEKHFENGKYPNPNLACAYPIIWAWQKIITEDNSISVIIDSDMFLIKDVSILEITKNYNFSFVPHYRGNMEIFYPWNGIVIADIPNMPNPKEMNWGCGRVNNIPVDVGGQGHFYLEKYKNELKNLYLSQMSIGDDRSNNIELTLNGYFGYFLNLQTNQVSMSQNPWNENKIFPHEKEKKSFFEPSLNFFLSMLNWITTYDFPKPTFVDLIKLEDDCKVEDSFIFHYKAGSNYMPWANDFYNKSKTKALDKVLDNFKK